MTEDVALSHAHCCFCSKSQLRVRYIVAGPDDTYICDGCIDLGLEFLQNEKDLEREGDSQVRACTFCSSEYTHGSFFIGERPSPGKTSRWVLICRKCLHACLDIVRTEAGSDGKRPPNGDQCVHPTSG